MMGGVPEFEYAACKGCGEDTAMSRNTMDENGLFCIQCRITGKHREEQDRVGWVEKRRAYLQRELVLLDAPPENRRGER